MSRLVRKSLSFSKKLSNHIGAIRYFLCDYNQWVFKKYLASQGIVAIASSNSS